ncbi:hypothetical protein CR513_27191, partial [Mucuna pruriens]
MKASRSQIRIMVVTTTRRMKVMENLAIREVIKIEEGRGNVIKRTYNECYSNKGKQKKEVEAQMAQGDSDDLDSDHVLLMVTTLDCVKFDFWYFDTGCSNHMTWNKEWFVNLDGKVKRMVMFVDNNIRWAAVMNMEHNMIKVYDNKRKLILIAPLSKNKTFKIGIQIA